MSSDSLDEYGPVTMSDRAYRFILDRVLANELKPGDWIDRREIASTLNSSLMPVSEAVQRLTREGFLVAVPRRGTQVKVPSLEDVRGQIIVRMALECQAARLVAGSTLREALPRLQAFAERADDRTKTNGSPMEADMAFHRELIALADCPTLLQTYDGVVNLTIFQHTALYAPYQLHRYDKHVQMLADLLTCDADAAEARVRWHIRSDKEHILDRIPVGASAPAHRPE